VIYRSGHCRNDAEYRLKSHTYVEEGGDLYPMCGYGWNRSGGTAFSILRGPYGSEGDCERCRQNLAAGKPPVRDGWRHPTKWL
jgi:hypothetical protein